MSPSIKFIQVLCVFFLTGLLCSGCNEKESLITDAITDYLPLQKGKYIIYRVDSLVFTQYGRQTETHSYLVKHLIDTLLQDSQGRPYYRIYKFISDSTGNGNWKSAGTYSIALVGNQLEYTEDNLRQIKLHSPIRAGFTWKGNTYLTTNPLDPPYNFSNDDDMQNWNYQYAGAPANFRYRDQAYTQVLTVSQIDTRFNAPVTIPTAYGFRNYAVDRFAKGIGLAYREWECWEYQPNTGGSGGPYKVGFGITQWMVSHN